MTGAVLELLEQLVNFLISLADLFEAPSFDPWDWWDGELEPCEGCERLVICDERHEVLPHACSGRGRWTPSPEES